MCFVRWHFWAPWRRDILCPVAVTLLPLQATGVLFFGAHHHCVGALGPFPALGAIKPSGWFLHHLPERFPLAVPAVGGGGERCGSEWGRRWKHSLQLVKMCQKPFPHFCFHQDINISHSRSALQTEGAFERSSVHHLTPMCITAERINGNLYILVTRHSLCVS